MSPLNFTRILTQTVDELSESGSYRELSHQHTDGNPLPLVKALCSIIELAYAIIFPGYFENSTVNSRTVIYHTGVDVERLFSLLTKQILVRLCFGSDDEGSCHTELQHGGIALVTVQFISHLFELCRTLATDVGTTYNGSPAAHSFGEVISYYSAVRVVSNHRIAHELLVLGIPLISHIITEMTRSEIGIDTRPGAAIGSYLTIDHGTGMVIGETCVIGNSIKLYQEVILEAKSFPLDENNEPAKSIPQHPMLEDSVIVHSNATILGRITIGKDAVVGGNIWVTGDVPAGTRIVRAKVEKQACEMVNREKGNDSKIENYSCKIRNKLDRRTII